MGPRGKFALSQVSKHSNKIVRNMGVGGFFGVGSAIHITIPRGVGGSPGPVDRALSRSGMKRSRTLPDRIAHTARADHVIRLPRFSAPTCAHITPLADNLDCGDYGTIATQTSTANGTSIYKIVILSEKTDLAAGKEHIRISDDCQGYEVGHLFYGIMPHPTSQGIAMSAKNLNDNVAFIKRLFNRDTCGNEILYLQKGHAAVTRKISQKEFPKVQSSLGYVTKNSKAGAALMAQHLAVNGA